MKILKSTGELTDYDPMKIRRSLRRAGAKPEVVDHVLAKVEKELRRGMTTKDLYRIVHRVLKDENEHVAHRYNLRSALLKLGPAGFKFEKYVASVLSALGWETEIPAEELRGRCIHHEVDVIARGDGKTVMIEAKFRNDFRDFVKLKDTMATWARWADLNDASANGAGAPRFDEAWIVTNGKISSRSQAWALCKGMEVIGWKYPKKGSLEQLVDSSAMYPITAIDTLTGHELERFSEAGIMLCREVAEDEPEKLAETTGIAPRRAKHIVAVCKEVAGHA